MSKLVVLYLDNITIIPQLEIHVIALTLVGVVDILISNRKERDNNCVNN